MRRRLARREQLVRSRSRAKNEIHAVLMRRLQGRPPVSDLFGVKGRRWLRELELPVEEAETLAERAAPRRVPRLRDRRGRAADRARGAGLAARAPVDDRARRERDLRRDVSGRGRRHPPLPHRRRRWSGYLGLDPRVRQSGNEPASGGRISKRGSASARWVLVEAAWSVVQQPGPLRAFYQRLRARRGHGKAIVAVARKLAVLFWCLLTPRRGLRPPAALADRQKAPAGRDHRRRPDPAGQADRRVRHPRTDARRPSASSPSRPRPPTRGWSPTGKPPGRQTDQASASRTQAGASVTPGRAPRPSKGTVARQTTSP